MQTIVSTARPASIKSPSAGFRSALARFIILLLTSLPLALMSQTHDLTGYWHSDAGGCYQITQKGNEVIWAGEPGTSIRAQNIFHGAIAGNTITGLWYDLPSNQGHAFASSLSLRIENSNTLVKTSESDTYKGSVWTRVSGPCNAGNTSGNSYHWSCVHEHVGCTNPSPVCKRYDKDPILFSGIAQGYMEASYSDITLKGNLNGVTYKFQYFKAGKPLGSGSFVFSSDYKSFSGSFEDVNGHRGIWTGKQE